MQPSDSNKFRFPLLTTTALGFAVVCSVAGCLGRGYSLPSVGHSTHRLNHSQESKSDPIGMPIRSAVILATAFEVWRQIETDNATGHSSWVFKFQSACPLQNSAQQLFENMPKSFTSSIIENDDSEGWLVKATSSIQKLEMNESSLSKWVDSASTLSKENGCRLTGWQVLDVDARKSYGSDTTVS